MPLVTYHGAVGVPYEGTALDLGAYETTPVAAVSYTFTGNGNWDDTSNWLNSSMSPATVAAGTQIIINPVDGGECLLNIHYTVSPGAVFTVMAGKNFRIVGDLNIAY